MYGCKEIVADDRLNLDKNPFALWLETPDRHAPFLVLVETVLPDIGPVCQHVMDPALRPLLTSNQEPLLVEMRGNALHTQILSPMPIQVALEYPLDHDRLRAIDFQLLFLPLVAREFNLDRPVADRRT
ncbi:MAG: hypothetical protein OEV71_14260 [Nitrospira sp.]|nr:hypothetical protein [Nitrospira sp.]